MDVVPERFQRCDAKCCGEVTCRTWGACCTGACIWLFFHVVCSYYYSNQVLHEYGHRIPTFPCEAAPDSNPVDRAPPHHLQGCILHISPLFNETLVGTHRLSDASTLRAKCGALAKKAASGLVSNGTMVSFLGDASHHILRPWEPEKGWHTCLMVLGSHDVSSMVSTIKWARFVNLIIYASVFLWFTQVSFACMLFIHPDDATGLGLLGIPVIMILAYIYATYGPEALLVLVVLAVGCPVVLWTKDSMVLSDISWQQARLWRDLEQPSDTTSPPSAQAAPSLEQRVDHKFESSMCIGLQVGLLCGLIVGLCVMLGFALTGSGGHRVA